MTVVEACGGLLAAAVDSAAPPCWPRTSSAPLTRKVSLLWASSRPSSTPTASLRGSDAMGTRRRTLTGSNKSG